MSDFDRQRHNYSQSEPWPARDEMSAQPVTAAEASVSDRIAFIRKVYGLFFAATLFAIGGVLLGLTFPPLMVLAVEHPIIMFILMIGGVMGAQAVRHVPGVNLAALFGFTTFTGIIISPVLYCHRPHQPRVDPSGRRVDSRDFRRVDSLRVCLTTRLQLSPWNGDRRARGCYRRGLDQHLCRFAWVGLRDFGGGASSVLRVRFVRHLEHHSQVSD